MYEYFIKVFDEDYIIDFCLRGYAYSEEGLLRSLQKHADCIEVPDGATAIQVIIEEVQGEI